ncbi:MAG: glycoside hydrolase family 38 C-terminal domain-containing protein, partial [Omnitrophica WOR_2 bacterium]
HHAQMPQLLKLSGYRSYWFFRGAPGWETSAEFTWEGLDGSQIPAFWLPFGYAHTYSSPTSLPEFVRFFLQQFDALERFSPGKRRVGLAGADVSEPEAHVPVLVEQFNRQTASPFQIQIAVPADYEAVTALKMNESSVYKGELNPIFQGTYSSRIELKQYTREIERLLTTAEKVGVLLAWLGLPVDEAVLWRAWELALFNQAHDLMSGVMTDHVYEDTLRSYSFSQKLAEAELQIRLQSLAEFVDTRGEGIALVVFNALGWSRTDIVFATIGFTDRQVMAVKLVDPEGASLPVQLLAEERYPDGSLLSARIAFVARDIPALGCCVYHVVALPMNSAATGGILRTEANILENEYYRLEFDPAGGAISQLFVKDGGWAALRGPGNVVAMEEDRGDLWELYHALDGGSRIAMQDVQMPPQKGQAVFSNDQAGEPGVRTCGPVLSEFAVTHPFSRQGRLQTVVRLYTGLRRVDFHTRILNNDRFVRYRLLFPTSILNGQNTHEIPFGAIARPEGIEFPAQNWIDYGDGEKGVALLNRGIPGNNVSEGTLMLSLLRSTCITAYGYFGGYEPGMSSDTGFELGKELSFDYALVPHLGGWREAGVCREGLAFNHPLFVCPQPAHAGRLPARWGFLEITHPDVIVSAFKLSRAGSAVLRVYEAGGHPAQDVEIRFNAPVTSAEETNLMEDPGEKLAISGNTLKLNFRPFEIKTIRLVM